LIVLFIREHGYEAMFGGAQYTQFDCGDWFYWTMGHSLPTTVVLNRKQLPDSEPVENIGDVPAEPGLFHTQEDT
jgi:hypothetical protein